MLPLNHPTTTNRIRSQWKRRLRKDNCEEETEVGGGGGGEKEVGIKAEKRKGERCESAEEAVRMGAGSRKVSCGVCKVSRGLFGSFSHGVWPHSRTERAKGGLGGGSGGGVLLMAKPFTIGHTAVSRN